MWKRVAAPSTDQSTCNELMNEVWHPVVGYEGLYEVSNQGRVRSVDRWITYRNGDKHLHKGRLLSVYTNRGGYLAVKLYKDNKMANWMVHTLVAYAFLGPRPKDMQVRHGVFGQKVNTPENLSYGTRLENAEDALRDGTRARGTRQGSNKLTEAQVLEIYNAPRTPGSGRALAKQFGVDPMQISRIRNQKQWGWLTSVDANL